MVDSRRKCHYKIHFNRKTRSDTCFTLKINLGNLTVNIRPSGPITRVECLTPDDMEVAVLSEWDQWLQILSMQTFNDVPTSL